MTSTPFKPQDYQVSDSDNQAKRPRPRQAHDEFIQNFTTNMGNRKRCKRRVSNKPPIRAIHEIRRLRSQVASMEEELDDLESKWTNQLPDKDTLTIAQHSALEKYEAIQTEIMQRELHGILLQQQLTFATLQSALLRAPLHSSGEDMLEALHFETRLGCDAEEREKALVIHHGQSLATLPSIVDKFSKIAIDRVLQNRKEVDVDKPVISLSQIDITGCKDFSLVSSVFISEIPHTSLEEVYKAIVRYFEDIPTWMKRHFGVDAKRKRLNSEDSPVNYWRLNLDGSGAPATVNHVLCSKLTKSYGMFHMDAITNDSLYPVSTTDLIQYGLNGITIAPRKEVLTGKITSVTLKWLVVYRYNLLPDDPIIQRELENVRPILNGDLITSVVCGYLQENQHSSPREE
ncbi:hypothetical protein PHMEG_0003510 [Phytophthora megakarya]|uniref:Uncharacterized protein n=1 Tax=Phytophthora megakarya TaxID=4795 RepID=A0A225WW89_9STRA|nr:hypothetical protein PHMEG_0003510 [Phytophthora megakarya]